MTSQCGAIRPDRLRDARILRDGAIAWDAVEKYRTHANTDPLTNLLNRRGLDALLGFSRVNRFRDGATAVILAAINHFKAINASDPHGTP